MSTVYFQSYTISLAHRQRLHCAVPPFEGIFTSYICTKHDWNLTAAIKIIGGCLAVFFGHCVLYIMSKLCNLSVAKTQVLLLLCNLISPNKCCNDAC